MLSYRESGHRKDDGEKSNAALILLHSGGMSGAEWEPQLSEFGRHFHTIAPDQPGHGASAMVADTLTVGDSGRAVLELMDYLNIGQAHLVGSSMGGAVALWLTVNYPQRVEKLVVFRASYRKTENTHSGTREMADPDYWRRMGMERHLSRMHLEQGGPDAWQKVIGRVMQAHNPVTTDHNHSLETLAGITQPVLIVCGDRDPLVPLPQLLEMTDAIPNSGLWLLPYTTHVAATNTWRSDVFATEVLRFLQGRG